jgi:hypothetical protein
MLKKKYTVVGLNGLSYTNINMHRVIDRNLKLQKITSKYGLARINSETILSDFGVEFIRLKDFFSGETYTNCKYIIEDGTGRVVEPDSLLQEYISVRNFLSKKINSAVNETFPFCRYSYGIKKYKRRVTGSNYRKARTSSLKNELKSSNYAEDFDVKVRNKRVQEVRYAMYEGALRKTKKSWKYYKQKKQWMKVV